VDGCCAAYCCINLKVNVLLKIIKEHPVLAMYLFRMIVAISNQSFGAVVIFLILAHPVYKI